MKTFACFSKIPQKDVEKDDFNDAKRGCLNIGTTMMVTQGEEEGEEESSLA